MALAKFWRRSRIDAESHPDSIVAVGQAPNYPRSREIGAHHRPKRAPTIGEICKH